jgi:hypothetical protein
MTERVEVGYETDNSSGHKKGKEDGLKTEGMNCNWGGKQRLVRDSILTTGCLGPDDARGVIKVLVSSGEDGSAAIMESRRLEIGDVQSMVFQEGDHPPWYQPTAEPYDRLQADMHDSDRNRTVRCKDREGSCSMKVASVPALVPVRKLWCRALWANRKEFSKFYRNGEDGGLKWCGLKLKRRSKGLCYKMVYCPRKICTTTNY